MRMCTYKYKYINIHAHSNHILTGAACDVHINGLRVSFLCAGMAFGEGADCDANDGDGSLLWQHDVEH